LVSRKLENTDENKGKTGIAETKWKTNKAINMELLYEPGEMV